MTSLVTILNFIKGLGGFLMKFLPELLIFKAGEKNERLKNAEESIENVKKANRVESNSNYDDKLREKYNRNK